MYPVQYLHNRLPGTWTRICSEACEEHGPGLRKEKSHRKEKAIYQRKRQIHILKKKEAVLKHRRENKEQNNVQKEKLIQSQIVYVKKKS